MADVRNPAELLPPSLAASIGAARWADTARIDDEYGADLIVVGYEVPAVIDAAAIGEAEACAAVVREACRPLDEQDILVELGKLYAKCARRQEGDQDRELLLEAYCEELAEYPADLVLLVLRRWARMSRYWPAWDELREMLDWRVRQRRGLLKALEAVEARGRESEAA